MGMSCIEAEHVWHSPTPHRVLRCSSCAIVTQGRFATVARRFDKRGFKHVRFTIEDIQAEVRKLTASGIEPALAGTQTTGS
jgi:hypothetical protein